MKVVRIEMFLVAPRWQLLRMETDEGVVGWSEAMLEGRAATVRTAVNELMRIVMGTDPRRIEDQFQRMVRRPFYRFGPVFSSALAAVEIALWDIKARALGVPIYDLMGGAVRDRLGVYGHVEGDTLDALRREAQKARVMGVTIVKLPVQPMLSTTRIGSYIDAQIERYQCVRQAMGEDGDVAVDIHGRLSPAVARMLCRELDPMRPYFIEEPVLPQMPRALRQLRNSVESPLAVGERLYMRGDFRDIIQQRLVDIVQPDVAHAGGLWETRKIAAMGELEDIQLAPHCAIGPIALAASLQLAVCTPNFLCQELGESLGDNILKQPLHIHNGYIDRPSGPGLGIEIEEQWVRQQDRTQFWDPPQILHEDGSIGEW
ncbi:MAG: galactonate dehydratase [Sulfobacillus benefaciens]|uniref:Galactonate dehydratase n=1 Tax=Sulfobacillus benefaciens TaxID=453960 RepID=A0A2T2XDH4_9FIRM|nr:MAG: galactonate dehydratase [Sulfobacillus benefaciens]